MTNKQDMDLMHAVKRAMGSHYNTKRSCVENIQRLVNNYDDLVEKQELERIKSKMSMESIRKEVAKESKFLDDNPIRGR